MLNEKKNGTEKQKIKTKNLKQKDNMTRKRKKLTICYDNKIIN